MLLMNLFLLIPVQPADARTRIPFSQKEIASAPEYELEFLQKLLGIESRELLLDELLGLSYDSAEAASESDLMREVEAVSRIDIQHADTVQYLSVENHRIVIFSGGVKLLYIQNGSETAFQADYLLYDDSAGILAASGDVQLLPGDAEAAAGTILFYNLKTDSGVLFTAETDYTLLREAESASKTIRIRGDAIEFASDSSLHISNGTITTAGDETYLSIKTDAMHLLKDGDWSVRSAVLYIGNIPVFYAPVFFYPGRRLISNPSAGIDEERGLFLQNTFYLKGTPDISAESDSLFAASVPGGTNAAWVKDTYGRSYTAASLHDPAEPADSDAPNSDYFKLYWDVYADPEVHAGFDLFRAETGVLKDAALKGGITVGKNRFSRLGESIPLGAYLDASGIVETEKTEVSVKLPFYSDQYIARDMLNRFEKFSISSFFSPVEWDSAYTRMHNLEWSVQTETENIKFGRNGAQTLRIDEADAYMVWTTNTSAGGGNYMPYKLVFPAVSFSLKGPIFSYSLDSHGGNDVTGSRKASDYGDDAAGETLPEDIMLEPDLLPGWKEEKNLANHDQAETVNAEDKELLLLKDFPLDKISAASAVQKDSLFTLSSHYQLSHDFSMYTLFSEDPKIYSANSSVKGSAALTNSLFDDFLTSEFRISPKWNAALRIREYGIPTDELIDAEKDSSYLHAAGEFSAAIPNFGLSYALEAELYENYYLDELYDAHTFSFTEDSVKTHRISYQLKNDLRFRNVSSLFTAAAELPPTRPALTLAEKLGNNSASVLVKSVFTESESQQSESGARWSFSSFTASFQYDNANFNAENTFFLHAEDQYFSNETEMNAELFEESVIFSAETLITDRDRNSAELDRMSLAVSADNTKLTFISGMHNPAEGENMRNFRIQRGILDSVIRFQASTGKETENAKKKEHKTDTGTEQNMPGSSMAAGDLDSEREKPVTAAVSGLFDLYWDLNFIKPAESLFRFKSKIYVEITDFLTAGFSSVSSNKRIGSYLNAASDNQSSAGMFMKDFFVNLAKSCNFFSRQDRLESDFNIESYAVDVVHMMPDWDFHLQVDGKLALINRTWVWDPKVSVFLEWKIMPEIQLDKDIDF